MPSTDTRLLLRAHAEHHWLQSELIPVLRQLEDPGQLDDGEMEVALAYLEMAWAEAARRARKTDLEFARLEREPADSQPGALVVMARGYGRWVRALAGGLTKRVDPLVAAVDAEAADPYVGTSTA
jgi:hypothetical protein